MSAPNRKPTLRVLPDCRGGESAAGVTDLGEQPGGADGAGAGQAGHDGPVRVHAELFGDPVREGLDLAGQGPQHRDVGRGDRGVGVGMLDDAAGRR